MGTVLKRSGKKSDTELVHERAEELFDRMAHDPGSSHPECDPPTLMRELEVGQIELELQNQELQDAKEKLVLSGERYAELFDFAPVGYFLISKEEIILEVNLIGSVMLGAEWSRLVGSEFALYASEATRPVVRSFLARLFDSGTKETCDATLRGSGSESLSVNLAGVVCGRGNRSFVSAIDVTMEKRAEEVLREAGADRVVLTAKLQEALRNNTMLESLLPLCANCKKILDDEGVRSRIKTYFVDHPDAGAMRSVCPDCEQLLSGDAPLLKRGRGRIQTPP